MTVAPTTGPATAGAIAREHIAGGADLILAAGGDGTVNEVLEGMVHSRVPLGVLPAGTANVLACEMKLEFSLERAAAQLGQCHPHRISVGHVTCDAGQVCRHFLLMAGVGLDAHIVRQVSVALKARTGKLAYWIAGGNLLGRRLAEFHVEIDGRTSVCSFALFSKVRNYGGDFEIAREVSLFDNEFEAVLFSGPSSIRYVKYLAGMVLRRLQHMSGVDVLHTCRVSLNCAEDQSVYVQVDGEFAGALPAELRIVPDALTLLIPPSYESRHGIQP